MYFEGGDRVRHITHPSTASTDEEKRLTYVALSRARDRLFLCIPPDVPINADELRARSLHVIDLREAL